MMKPFPSDRGRCRSSCRRPRAHKRKAWTSDEARRFLASARADRDVLYAAHVLVLVVGLRKGEVLGFTWDDVDLDRAELTVGRNAAPTTHPCGGAQAAPVGTEGVRGGSRSGVAAYRPRIHHPIRYTDRAG